MKTTLALMMLLLATTPAMAGSTYYPEAYGGRPDYGHERAERAYEQEQQRQLQEQQLYLERQQLEEMRRQTRELQGGGGRCTGAFC
jgi:hypothetical protein